MRVLGTVFYAPSFYVEMWILTMASILDKCNMIWNEVTCKLEDKVDITHCMSKLVKETIYIIYFDRITHIKVTITFQIMTK